MPESLSLNDVLGKSVDRPRRQLNSDGAVIAVTFTQAQWDALEPRLKSEHDGYRSVATRCAIRGLVSVDAFVVPAESAAAPKPWSRTERQAGPRLAA